MATTKNITLYAPKASGSGGSVTNYALTYRSFNGVPLSKIISPSAPTGYKAGLLYKFKPGSLIVFPATGTKSDKTTKSTWIGFRVIDSVNNFATNIQNSNNVAKYDTYFVGQVRGFFEIPYIDSSDGYTEFTNSKIFNDATMYNLNCNLRAALTTSGSPIHNCVTIDNQIKITIPVANVYKGNETTEFTSFDVNLDKFRLGDASANDENNQSFEGIWINRV